MAPFFQAITEAQRHMEDLQLGQELAKSWPADLEAILRPCRWIDGIGILAACETMQVRVVIMRWRKRTQQRMPTGFF
eukprot:4844245-Alexandrium_andersonii.AAC.1